ncbi:SRPBCC domain-containing protein [Amorphoplanes nipponensis]|uniref:Activator of HSP90 ATPase n=1 Tax=Actinoplanes nipponensis TaxID=135950 RepID=A0A919JDP6_9ACTN|nr:SRPBCC domain-containing protein [Actinoplanes nipponensis]GIE47672.1 activator of HSP90 ATPase [Actinoplanes nipponensis]
MTVTGVHKDPRARTMTLTAEFAATAAGVWQLWADPRRLERWWGPPTHPATVVEHDLRPGGAVSYFVTGPDGARSPGWWRVLAVSPPYGLEFELGDPGIPPLLVRVRIEEHPGRARMVVVTTFPSADAMDQLIVMGFEQGLTAAVGQIDEVLGAGPGR